LKDVILLRNYTPKELSQLDGVSSEHICISVAGRIYDVTRGKSKIKMQNMKIHSNVSENNVTGPIPNKYIVNIEQNFNTKSMFFSSKK